VATCPASPPSSSATSNTLFALAQCNATP
jgi:hypothetical protein